MRGSSDLHQRPHRPRRGKFRFTGIRGHGARLACPATREDACHQQNRRGCQAPPLAARAFFDGLWRGLFGLGGFVVPRCRFLLLFGLVLRGLLLLLGSCARGLGCLVLGLLARSLGGPQLPLGWLANVGSGRGRLFRGWLVACRRRRGRLLSQQRGHLFRAHLRTGVAELGLEFFDLFRGESQFLVGREVGKLVFAHLLSISPGHSRRRQSLHARETPGVRIRSKG